MLLTDHRVNWVWDQPPPVQYRDREGTLRQHTFDFLAIRHDGRRVAFAVKPESKLASSGISETVKLIELQMDPRFANTARVRTERHITKARAHNARLIFSTRKFRPGIGDAMNSVNDVTRSLVGSASIRDIVAATGLDWAAFRAVVCLIDDGVLTPADNGKLSYRSMVKRQTVEKVAA